MLDSSVIQILIVLGFPYAIGALRSFFAKAPPPSPLQRINNQQGEKVSSRTRAWNRSMLLLLGLTALYHVFYVVFYDPPNIFKTLSLPADCPNFILHQSWKERAALDPAFMNKYPDSMRERFKAMENRLWYEVYGQDAFLNCEYCTERSDFMRYLIPGAMASYVGMAVILGIATTQTSHLNKYRTWGSAALVIISVLEYGTYQRSADIGSLPGLMKHEGWIVGFRGAHLLRHGSLAMMSVVLMGVLLRSTRGGGLRDEVEILNDLCQAQEGMIQRHRALQLARAASLRDPVLRKQFVDYWKKREVEHGLLLSDMEYKEARDLALSRIDVETITQEADEYIDAIIKAGERVSEPMEADASANPAEQTKTAAST
ncbi:hypothetical protein BC939DRAFT_433773 [Gamsiella multidivaricata]|uniref:uncharacterized protein n=1 Tax=Gamsiella multidivaricata TaxID=101098 RepID=UPI00221E9512|nr:uncharacterized protein BC939DRAFT_433773 [Gamsiella multidivaricata]KAG0370197.1 hypothetical protein BGZ54_007306 [Gamsiella multidivaricata]KAI7832576.1 hypothetical protein BC939DRAFT_433773 [Gamsiella multidivaricata]